MIIEPIEHALRRSRQTIIAVAYELLAGRQSAAQSAMSRSAIAVPSESAGRCAPQRENQSREACRVGSELSSEICRPSRQPPAPSLPLCTHWSPAAADFWAATSSKRCWRAAIACAVLAAAIIRSWKPQGVEVVRGDIRDNAARSSGVCRDRLCLSCGGVAGHRHATATRIEAVNQRGHRALLANCTAMRRAAACVTRAARASCSRATINAASMNRRRTISAGWTRIGRTTRSRRRAPSRRCWRRMATSCGRARCGRILIWGPGDTHLIPRLIARARSGRLRRVGDGTNLVDITYVENAAEAHLLAADALDCAPVPPAEAASPGGKAYFISQGEPVNCWQWIDEVLALAGFAAGGEDRCRGELPRRDRRRVRGRVSGCCGSRASRR